MKTSVTSSLQSHTKIIRKTRNINKFYLHFNEQTLTLTTINEDKKAYDLGSTEEGTNEKPIHISEPWKHLAIGGIRYQAESEGLIKGLYNNTPKPSFHLCSQILPLLETQQESKGLFSRKSEIDTLEIQEQEVQRSLEMRLKIGRFKSPAHAYRACKHLFNEPFLIMNAHPEITNHLRKASKLQNKTNSGGGTIKNLKLKMTRNRRKCQTNYLRRKDTVFMKQEQNIKKIFLSNQKQDKSQQKF